MTLWGLNRVPRDEESNPLPLDHKSGTGGVGGGAPDEHITVIPYLNSSQKTTPTRFLLQLAQLGLLGALKGDFSRFSSFFKPAEAIFK